MAEKKDSTSADLVEYLQGILADSYEYAIPHFERKDFIQRLFDGDLEAEDWPTMSEVHIPALRSAVKSAIPDAVQYAFPSSGFVSLMPRSGGISFDEVRTFERALDDLLIYKMQVAKNSIPILQDGLKFGSGYGIVEKVAIVTEKSSLLSVTNSSGEVIATNRRIGVSATPTIVPRLRYLNYESVIPYPDGDDPESTSCTMVIDYYREDEFRNLYKMQAASDEKLYLGDPEALLKEAETLGINGGVYPHFWNILMLGGESTATMQTKYQKIQNMISKRAGEKKRFGPMLIPVAKYFFKNEHIWVVNGTTIIYHEKESYETLRSPVLKASPDIDSNNWWVQSDIAASRDMAMATNHYHNAVFDLLTQYLRPMSVYDTSRYDGGEPPRHEPWGQIPVTGNVKDAYAVVTPPPIAPGLLNIAQGMELKYKELNGDPLNGQANAGLLRGGSNAFETLLQTQNGRRELTGFIYDMNFIEPLIKMAMIHMQTLPVEEYQFIEVVDRNYVETRISLNDVRHEFDVNVDMKHKVRNSISEKMTEMTLYQQVYRDNPWIRQKEALEIVIGDKEKSRILIATDEEYKTTVDQINKANAGVEKPVEPESTQGEQAVSGGLGRMSA